VAGDLGDALDVDRRRLRSALGEGRSQARLDFLTYAEPVRAGQHRIDVQLARRVDDPVLGQRGDPGQRAAQGDGVDLRRAAAPRRQLEDVVAATLDLSSAAGTGACRGRARARR
jgi:hypothetical protein